MGECEGRAMDHLGIPLDVALALRLVRAQPRRGRGALPHRAAPHGCRNQRREPRDLPNQAAILRARTCVSVSLLERHSLRSHSGYTRARHPVTLFHGNEATLPSPHHKDQPGSQWLSPLWAAHERYRSTLGLTALSHKHTHTRNVRRCTYEIGIPPRKGHPGLHTRVSSLWTRCARSCYTALHATRLHLLAVGARRRRHWTHGCHVARASRSGQRRCIIKRPIP